jgi:hypothetical protein
MAILENLRTMDKRLRLMLTATALLLVPQIGQFIAIRDLNFTGRESPLAVLFMVIGIFIVPTSFILTLAILFIVRKVWRSHERLCLLGVLNIVLISSITWFFFSQCSWAAVFGLVLHGCR